MKQNKVPKPQCIVKKTEVSYPKFPVIDFHTHMGKLVLGDGYERMYNTKEHVKRLKELGIKHTVNLDGIWGDELDKMLEKVGDEESFITTFCWIDVTKIDDDDFDAWVINHLETAYKKGCKGIKMWKVISLNQKDASGNYIRTDDPRLAVVYNTAARLGMVILIHIADPTAFFEEINEENERSIELAMHPDWQFGKPEQYSFDELMQMQDHMIELYPNTTFVVAHFGSYAENLTHVANRLDRYPNMYIDIAARVAELGTVPYSAREFFITYQDRIVFGTDETPLDYFQYPLSFRFLETSDEYFPYWEDETGPQQGNWYIYGLHLPDEVLEKIYYRNACALLGIE